MRNEKTWLEKIRPRYLTQHFTPRLIHDLETIKPPNIEKINSLFIYGPTESGKTVLAAFLLVEEQKRIYLEGGPRDVYDYCCFVSFSEMINQIRETYNSPDKGDRERVLDRYMRCRLLVLDDFGTIKPTDWVLETVYMIINYRYEYLKKTIITSNKSLEQIASLFDDDRITSRIERMGAVKEKQPYGR